MDETEPTSQEVHQTICLTVHKQPPIGMSLLFGKGADGSFKFSEWSVITRAIHAIPNFDDAELIYLYA